MLRCQALAASSSEAVLTFEQALTAARAQHQAPAERQALKDVCDAKELHTKHERQLVQAQASLQHHTGRLREIEEAASQRASSELSSCSSSHALAPHASAEQIGSVFATNAAGQQGAGEQRPSLLQAAAVLQAVLQHESSQQEAQQAHAKELHAAGMHSMDAGQKNDQQCNQALQQMTMLQMHQHQHPPLQPFPAETGAPAVQQLAARLSAKGGQEGTVVDVQYQQAQQARVVSYSRAADLLAKAEMKRQAALGSSNMISKLSTLHHLAVSHSKFDEECSCAKSTAQALAEQANDMQASIVQLRAQATAASRKCMACAALGLVADASQAFEQAQQLHQQAAELSKQWRQAAADAVTSAGRLHSARQARHIHLDIEAVLAAMAKHRSAADELHVRLQACHSKVSKSKQLVCNLQQKLKASKAELTASQQQTALNHKAMQDAQALGNLQSAEAYKTSAMQSKHIAKDVAAFIQSLEADLSNAGAELTAAQYSVQQTQLQYERQKLMERLMLLAAVYLHDLKTLRCELAKQHSNANLATLQAQVCYFEPHAACLVMLSPHMPVQPCCEVLTCADQAHASHTHMQWLARPCAEE